MEPIDKAWLACALETEGCISFYKKYLRLFICNTSLEFIQRVMNICGVGYMNIRKGGSSMGKKQLYVYTVSGAQAQRILADLQPYMVMSDKRLKVEKALSMHIGRQCFNPYWINIPRNPDNGRFYSVKE